MKLEPINADLGLWVNPGWQQHSPGAFAIVIGVSEYEHLDGTAGSLTLTSLKVSALTAYRFFQWLGTDYHVEGCEIAKCFLLLAPTKEEVALEPEMAKYALKPDWQNCELAIRWWYDYMRLQSPRAANASRGIFFFSGHGIEKNLNLQLLLPSDYLQPPGPNFNRAISTSNLAIGLATLKVPLHIFFIDGCRNAPKQLRDKTIVGTPILSESTNSNADVADEDVINPAYVAPMLLATSSGQAAFQPRSVDKGISLFGSALLDGLAGQPNIELVRRPTTSQVNIFPLQKFTEARVSGQFDRQWVSLCGQSRDATVTELPPPLGQRDEQDRRLPHLMPADVPSAAALLAALQQGPTAVESISRESLSEHAPLDVPRSIWSQDEERTHNAFGSERASQMWMRDLRLLALSTNTVVGDIDAIAIRRVVHDSTPTHWEVELSIDHDDPLGHGLELRDSTGDYWCTLLMRLDDTRPIYRVQFDLATHEEFAGRPLIGLESTLADGQSGTAGLMALLWRAHRYGGPSMTLAVIEALRDEPSRRLQGAPVAAIFAGLLAIRYGDLRLAGELIQMVTASATLPDQPPENVFALMRLAGDWKTLMAAWLVRQGSREAAGDSGSGLGRVILAGGLPHTVEGFFAAQDALRRLLAGSTRVPAEDRRDLVGALARLDAATSSLAGNGLFLSCANTSAEEAMGMFFASQILAGHEARPASFGKFTLPYELDEGLKALLNPGGSRREQQAAGDDDDRAILKRS